MASQTLIKDGNGATGLWNPKYITTATTTLVKTGGGILHSITINKPVATGVIEIDDAVTNTNPIATITSSSAQPVTLIYDVVFKDGLSITTSVSAQDITVAYA